MVGATAVQVNRTLADLRRQTAMTWLYGQSIPGQARYEIAGLPSVKLQVIGAGYRQQEQNQRHKMALQCVVSNPAKHGRGGVSNAKQLNGD